ncbi:cyclic peptide transporter, partial [Pseudomonas urmiensis]
MTDPKRGAFKGLLALLRPFRTIVTVSVALGMAGGLAITLLLATINTALHSSTGMTQGVILTFAALCLLALISSIVSDIGTN